MLKTLKHYIEKIPYPIGRRLALVPFSWRLGRDYPHYCRLAAESENWSDAELECYILPKLRNIVEYARNKFPFYRELYRQYGVDDLHIRDMADFTRLPIITKAMLREHLEEFSGAYKLNTGGTTGTPFAFYVDKNAWAREWAHMHRIWGLKGYDYRDVNLALRGKNLDGRNIVYNPVHNEFLINTYRELKDFGDELARLLRRHDHYYIHGYPSALYNFILEAEKVFGQEELERIFGRVRALLLHSEFPLPYMVEKFQQYQLDYISWYGHSEMCILACDAGKNNHYRPLPTYGLAEVSDGRLLGSSFHNPDMPLIRYDTGDLVEKQAETAGGICTSFGIAAGRNGDFLADRQGKRIPLTSLIFGRHHKAFEYVEHLQIHQEQDGEATIYLITGKNIAEPLNRLFDLSNVDIDFKLVVKEKPFLTAAGKLRLKI